MRAKEFLSQRGIRFTSRDVLNDPLGQEEFAQLGARAVPVLAARGQYIFCQNLEDVAEFVGLQGTGHVPLPPEVLVTKWLGVLSAAQRYLRQIPDARLGERVVANRDRSIRLMSHHIFRIVEAFLETALEDVEYWVNNANVPPNEGTCTAAAEIAAYGDQMAARLQAWWDGLEEKSCRQPVRTFYGTPPLHQLLERSTWHSAQHTRQLAAVLERFGIEPDGPLSSAELAGLPLPQGLWE